LEFYKYVVGERNSSLIDTYVSDHYIQHSPSLKVGKAGLLEAIEYLKKLPEPKEKKSPIISAIEDGDFVMVQLDLAFMGNRKSVIDIFRLQDGMVVEHWDAIQDRLEQTGTQVHIHAGMMVIEDIEQTEMNKSLIQRVFHEVIQHLEVENKYVSPDYMEHNPEVMNAGDRLDTYLSDTTRRLTTKVHRILGEGNLVLVQSEGKKSSKPFVFYDLFKIKTEQIVEHWSVEQEIPNVMAHANGMI